MKTITMFMTVVLSMGLSRAQTQSSCPVAPSSYSPLMISTPPLAIPIAAAPVVPLGPAVGAAVPAPPSIASSTTKILLVPSGGPVVNGAVTGLLSLAGSVVDPAAPLIQKVTEIFSPCPTLASSFSNQGFIVQGTGFGKSTAPAVQVAAIGSACVMNFPYLEITMGTCQASSYPWGITSTIAIGIPSSVVSWSDNMVVLNAAILKPNNTVPFAFTITNNDTGKNSTYCFSNSSQPASCATSTYFN